MDDTDIVQRIGALTDEEHKLELAHAGADPDLAAVRPEDIVERYQQ